MPSSALEAGRRRPRVAAARDSRGDRTLLRRGAETTVRAPRCASATAPLGELLGLLEQPHGAGFLGLPAVARDASRRQAHAPARDRRLGEYLELLAADAGEAAALAKDLLLNVTEFFGRPRRSGGSRTDVLPRLFAMKSGDHDTAARLGRRLLDGRASVLARDRVARAAGRRSSAAADPSLCERQWPRSRCDARDSVSIRPRSRTPCRRSVWRDSSPPTRARLSRAAGSARRGRIRVPRRRSRIFRSRSSISSFAAAACSRFEARRARRMPSCGVFTTHCGRTACSSSTRADSISRRRNCSLPMARRCADLCARRAEATADASGRDGGGAARDEARRCGDASVRPVDARSLHLGLLERYAPASVLVDADQRVLHYSAHASRYVRLPGGEVTHDLVELVARAAAQRGSHRARGRRARRQAVDLEGRRGVHGRRRTARRRACRSR